jgi:hypothetical protein
VTDLDHHATSARDISERRDEIVAAAEAGLGWARGAWPDVAHDARGMAITG